MDRRKKLFAILGIGLIILGVTGFVVYKFSSDTDPPEKAPEGEQTTKERLSTPDIGSLKEKANDDADAFHLIVTNGSVLENSGDPDGAEEYYIAALNHAKGMQDQDLIDAGYRYILAYYKSTGKNDKYDSVVNELGEDGMARVYKPDPRDEGQQLE